MLQKALCLYFAIHQFANISSGKFVKFNTRQNLQAYSRGSCDYVFTTARLGLSFGQYTCLSFFFSLKSFPTGKAGEVNMILKMFCKDVFW